MLFRSEIQEIPAARPLAKVPGDLVFEHVTFGYDPEKPVLCDINLRVAHGEVIAIVGPTGAGKSTLTSLLPRFYDPQQGRITIDGVDIRELKLDHLRRQIGMVFQETFLFSDTIAANIAYGDPHADPDRIRRAAAIAQAAEFIDQAEKQYDTVIGERGVSLSGGQRQRLAIARAIATDPRILILDDALAAVDPTTEHEIIAGLDDVFAGRTVLLIAHRLSSVKRAHRVVVIEHGQITHVGTHDELMAADGHYKTMAQIQLMHDEDHLVR